MKPKNRVMCPDCGRPKMLFETEKKAETFIKFNASAINPKGDRTIRVYYCPACCGYHISSHEYHGDNLNTDRLIARYKETLSGKRDITIESIKLCDELITMKFDSRSELNAYLRSRKDIEQNVKDGARECFYKRTGLNKVWQK